MQGQSFDQGKLIPTGILQEVNPTRQIHSQETGNADFDYHVKAKTHYWIVLVQHKATDRLLDNIDGLGGELPILDADTMSGMPVTCCMICEVAYEPRLRRRKCPGEPR